MACHEERAVATAECGMWNTERGISRGAAGRGHSHIPYSTFRTRDRPTTIFHLLCPGGLVARHGPDERRFVVRVLHRRRAVVERGCRVPEALGPVHVGVEEALVDEEVAEV